MEEVYVFLYEITNEENKNTVPILPCYATSDEDGKTQLTVFAKFPTDSSLKNMALAYGITQDFNTVGAALSAEVFHELSGLQQEFNNKIYLTTVKYKGSDRIAPAKGNKIHGNYLKVHQEFQLKHNICIAILGGLHRTLLALHILGNYMIHNNVPGHYTKSAFNIT
jgi:hypothetical protein